MFIHGEKKVRGIKRYSHKSFSNISLKSKFFVPSSLLYRKEKIVEQKFAILGKKKKEKKTCISDANTDQNKF